MVIQSRERFGIPPRKSNIGNITIFDQRRETIPPTGPLVPNSSSNNGMIIAVAVNAVFNLLGKLFTRENDSYDSSIDFKMEQINNLRQQQRLDQNNTELREELHFPKHVQRHHRESQRNRELGTQLMQTKVYIGVFVLALTCTYFSMLRKTSYPLFRPTFYSNKAYNNQASTSQSTSDSTRSSDSTSYDTSSSVNSASSSEDGVKRQKRRGNDPPKRPRETKKEQLTKNSPLITVQRDSFGRVIRLTAIIGLENLRQGSGTNPQMRERIRELGLRDDVAGHLLASMLGGSGTHQDNIVPMSSKFNNGVYKSFELLVRDWLETELNQVYVPGEPIDAKIVIEPIYSDDNSWRPQRIRYTVDIYINGRFSHSFSALFNCP